MPVNFSSLSINVIQDGRRKPLGKLTIQTLRMMYKTSFYGFSGMRNPFLTLIFQFKVNVMSNSRWPYKAILTIELFNYLSYDNAYCVMLSGLWYVECIFVISLLLSQGYVNILIWKKTQGMMLEWKVDSSLK